jgi:hypothetical protein
MLCVVVTILLFGCGSGGGDSESEATASNGTGAIAVNLVFQDNFEETSEFQGVQTAGAQFDCESHSVEWVTVQIIDASNPDPTKHELLTQGTERCLVGYLELTGVRAGSKRIVTASLTDDYGTVLYEGKSDYITVIANQINPATIYPVAYGNRKPEFIEIAPQEVNEGETLKFTVEATDPDGDAMTFSASNLPEGAKFNEVTREFSWTPTANQTNINYKVLFTVTDDGNPRLSDQMVVTIKVGDVCWPPQFKSIPDQQVSPGQELVFTVEATDPDNDPLSYEAEILPEGARFNEFTREFSWIPNDSQANKTYQATFVVYDSCTDPEPQTDRMSVNIVVGNVLCEKPIINKIGEKRVEQGKTLEFFVTVENPSPDILYGAQGIPSGATFDTKEGKFSWAPGCNQTGTYSVTFTATRFGNCDPPQTSEPEVATIIVEPAVANDPPVIIIKPTTYYVSCGEKLDFLFTVRDSNPNAKLNLWLQAGLDWDDDWNTPELDLVSSFVSSDGLEETWNFYWDPGYVKESVLPAGLVIWVEDEACGRTSQLLILYVYECLV